MNVYRKIQNHDIMILIEILSDFNHFDVIHVVWICDLNRDILILHFTV